MHVIQLPLIKSPSVVNVHGAFNFLNAGDLIFRLENALELAQNATSAEKVVISVHCTYLDLDCKRLMAYYLNEIEIEANQKTESNVRVLWHYEWFDDDILEYGRLLEESCILEFTFVEIDQRWVAT